MLLVRGFSRLLPQLVGTSSNPIFAIIFHISLPIAGEARTHFTQLLFNLTLLVWSEHADWLDSDRASRGPAGKERHRLFAGSLERTRIDRWYDAVPKRSRAALPAHGTHAVWIFISDLLRVAQSHCVGLTAEPRFNAA
jgi:hypothetical protein